MEHPKAVGDRSTLAIMLALQSAGYAVLVPFGENTRYDLVIDDGAVLRRVLCKTGRLRLGAIAFKTCSTYDHHPNPGSRKRDDVREVDFFAVYCRETGGVYLIPIDDITTTWQARLRVEPARNGQKCRTRTARAYEIAVVSSAPTAEPGATAGAG